MGFVTSEPLPLAQRIGIKLARTEQTVMSFGRSRCTAPSMAASSISAFESGRPEVSRLSSADHSGVRSPTYLIGREPVIRMSTSLLALCCQSGLEATLETPIRARSRSKGSRSRRMSPLLMARFTSPSIAP
jgi:hypothetical protein